MGYFPFFVQLQHVPGLIVGGGTVALRKAEKLLPYGPKLTVVAPDICPELAALPSLTLVRRPFRGEDVGRMAFVIAASGDRALNHRVARLCREKGIPVNVVDDKEACSFLFPALVKRGELSVGISSAIAIPAAAGIPVTHRGLSRSFHVITGHTADTPDGLPRDLDKLAGLEGTLVFLMGLGRLEQIARRLMEGGRRGDTPAAVLSGGNSPHPAAVRGTLETIAQRAAGVRPPAVIVVGETAGLDLSPTVFRSLTGVRVGITGTEQVTGRLTRALEELGADCLRVERPGVERLDWPLEMLDGPGNKWLVFTSANGVRAFFHRLREARRDVRTLARCSFAVIGRATGAALERRGIVPDLCPTEQTGRGLAQALMKAARPGEEMVLLRSEQGSGELPRLLEEAGFPVRDVATYRVTEEEHPAALPPLDCLTFASAGGVERFLASYGAVPPGCPCVCIGEVTADALEGRTTGNVAVAPDISVEGLAQAVTALLGRA